MYFSHALHVTDKPVDQSTPIHQSFSDFSLIPDCFNRFFSQKETSYDSRATAIEYTGDRLTIADGSDLTVTVITRLGLTPKIAVTKDKILSRTSSAPSSAFLNSSEAVNRTVRESLLVLSCYCWCCYCWCCWCCARRDRCGWKITRDEIVSGFEPDCGFA